MAKYPISSEFFPYTLFKAPVSTRAIAMSQKVLNVPRFVGNDAAIEATTHKVPAYQGGEIEILLIKPKDVHTSAPCLIDIHGGGFIFDAAPYHYRLALEYAKGAQCVVAFVRYRLAPDFPFPVPQEDCFCAAQWMYENATKLGIDPQRIGIGGDSAGGTLTASTCLMLRDRETGMRPVFQMLIYPWLDDRNNSKSSRKYTDVPMWNSSMSHAIGSLINPNPDATPLAYRSPVEAESLADLPPAYIEVAEFDSLHDDGVLYAQLLQAAGVDAQLHESKGTMHGFDIKMSAPTTQAMLAQRIAFISSAFSA